MKKPAAPAFTYFIALQLKSNRRRKEGTLTRFCEVVNYLLKSNATDDIIAKIDAEIFCYIKTLNMRPTEHAEALWNYALVCHLVSDEYVGRGIFIEGRN